MAIILALSLVSCTSALAADEGMPPFDRVKVDGNPEGEWRHAGKYPPLRVTWLRESRLDGVAAVFPHPTLPQRVALVTPTGLLLSDDAGRAWKPLPEAAPQKVGSVRHVGFDPRSPDAFYLATDTQGVWATSDAGKTFRQIGSKATGMASDATLAVHAYPADARLLTLLALHGDAAPGFSLTEDGGRTWRVVSPEYHVWKLLCGGADSHRLYMAASARDKPDVRSIFSCSCLGEPWYVVVRDVIPTDGARTVLQGDVFWATAESGLHVITHEGANFVKVGPPETARLASLGAAWGPTADSEFLYAYEPTKLGMIVSTDGFTTVSTCSQGLYTSPFVREGAHLRANANGTVFYAVANGVLSKGYRFDGPLKVSQISVSPAAMSFAPGAWHEGTWTLQRCLAVLHDQARAAGPARMIARSAREVEGALSAQEATVTALVIDSRGKPKSVTVDLSRLGGSPRTPMLDDGQHGDGAPGDNVYGAVFPMPPQALLAHWPWSRDWRRAWPGPLGLTVTAVASDGSLSGAVGVLHLAMRSDGFVFWGHGLRPDTRDCKGDVTLRVDPAVANPATSSASWKIVAANGPWVLPLGDPYHTRDISGLYAVSFWAKSDATRPDDLSLQLRDQPDYTAPSPTPPLGLVRDRAIEGGAITAEFRRVVVPLEPLLKRTPGFQPRLFCWLVFSGEGRAPATYWIDDLRFFPTKEDLDTELRLSPR